MKEMMKFFYQRTNGERSNLSNNFSQNHCLSLFFNHRIVFLCVNYSVVYQTSHTKSTLNKLFMHHKLSNELVFTNNKVFQDVAHLRGYTDGL